MANPTEYDMIYRDKPYKWTSPWRDHRAMTAITGHLDRQPVSLLDVGCGNGHTLDYMQAYWNTTSLSGLDISSVACRLAKANCPRAEIVHGGLEQLDNLGEFEAITLMGVAEHFDDIPAALVQVAAKLVPSGIIYVEAPDNMAIAGLTEEGWYASALQDEWHLRRETWEDKFKQAGLRIADSMEGGDLHWKFIWILERASDET